MVYLFILQRNREYTRNIREYTRNIKGKRLYKNNKGYTTEYKGIFKGIRV